jgi:hypothetical protein
MQWNDIHSEVHQNRIFAVRNSNICEWIRKWMEYLEYKAPKKEEHRPIEKKMLSSIARRAGFMKFRKNISLRLHHYLVTYKPADINAETSKMLHKFPISFRAPSKLVYISRLTFSSS